MPPVVVPPGAPGGRSRLDLCADLTLRIELRVHVDVRCTVEERVQEADVAPDRAGEGAVRVRLAGRAERNRDRAGCARRPEVNVRGGRRPAQVLEDHVPGKRAAGAFERDRRGEGTGARGGVFCPWSLLGGAERRLQGVALGGCLGRFRRGRRLRCRHRLLAAAATGRDDRDRGEKGGQCSRMSP